MATPFDNLEMLDWMLEAVSSDSGVFIREEVYLIEDGPFPQKQLSERLEDFDINLTPQDELWEEEVGIYHYFNG